MRRMPAIAASLLLTLPLVAAERTAHAVIALDVTIDTGVIHGIDTGHTLEWRGVPYAAAPIGNLRWRRPAPVTPWGGVRNATQFGPPCIQPVSPTDTIGSEDCLYLNVFAPPGTTSAAGLPVMVHLHGGSNSGFRPYENATAFVSHGVIVVTLAYRLGVFGFVGHPSLSAEGGGASGEYGELDQIAALHWVQNNIAGFGGDPHNVTLFGESAGSFDAAALVASPLAGGLFVRAALQTESFFAFYDPGTINDAEEMGSELASSVGCQTALDVAACLRALPAHDLVVALGPIDVAPRIGGEVLPASPRDLIGAQAHTVPLLLGSNREEATFFFPQPFTGEPYGYDKYVRDTNAIVSADAGRIIRRLYPISAYDSALWASVTAFSDGIYGCPIRALATTSSGPVWRYLYTHVYDSDEFLAGLRAAHFIDDPIMWHDADLLTGFGAADYQFSADEDQLSATMTGYWTNFAKTGDPNGPGLRAWPLADGPTRPTMVLDEPTSIVNGYHDRQCDYFDTVPIFLKAGWIHGGIPSFIPLPGPG